MELVDHLLAILAGPTPGAVNQQLMAVGYAGGEVRGASNYARAAGYTESTGLGADRLTSAGKGRAAEIGDSFQAT